MKEEASINSLPPDLMIWIVLMSIRPESVGKDLGNILFVFPGLWNDLKAIIKNLSGTRLPALSFKSNNVLVVQSSPQAVLKREFSLPRSSAFWRRELKPFTIEASLLDSTNLLRLLDQRIVDREFQSACELIKSIVSLDICPDVSVKDAVSNLCINWTHTQRFLVVLLFDKFSPEIQKEIKPVLFKDYSDDIINDSYNRTLKFLQDSKGVFIRIHFSPDNIHPMESVVQAIDNYIEFLTIFFNKEAELTNNQSICPIQ